MRNPGGPVPVVLALMKNTINVSNNVNLILNTYRCLFFFKLLLRTFDVVRQRGNGKVLESAALEIRKR